MTDRYFRAYTFDENSIKYINSHIFIAIKSAKNCPKNRNRKSCLEVLA